ncbi:hypothetical protein [Pseudomonas sp. NPDC089569]|uniref:hypothetical protein n=1 Tax=Pseudomonas sp. NPDC089569 TaxID=3390722 RepID=UPI003D01D7E6
MHSVVLNPSLAFQLTGAEVLTLQLKATFLATDQSGIFAIAHVFGRSLLGQASHAGFFAQLRLVVIDNDLVTGRGDRRRPGLPRFVGETLLASTGY